jgi:UDP-GlcNAc:undecaprenyl-phosphate/decaprenyl-phosphate GlcNAc-1-phosphate transferase
MDHALFGAGVLAACAGIAAALVPLTVRAANGWGILDSPGPRKFHALPTPRLGGIAVFTAFTAVVLIGYFVALPALLESASARAYMGTALSMLEEAHRVQSKLMGLLAGGAVVFAVGLTDDALGRRFPVALKAAGQLLAAAILVASGVRTSFMPGDALNVIVTLLWVVGMTNAFNLLDNMDGLSAGVALVASAVFLVNAWALGEFFISLLLLAFIGSLLGFLFYNYHPATVFLGDCGSLFIGYVIASLTLLESYVSNASSTLFPVLMPVLVLALPIMDTATVVLIRLHEGRPIYVGDRRHLSHRLVALGFSPRTAVLFIYLVTLSLGLGAVNLSDASPGQSAVILVQFVGLVALILILMFVERDEGQAGLTGAGGATEPRRPEIKSAS